MQIAITLADDKVDEIDALVPGSYKSRAEVVRHAVDEFLRRQRTEHIDRQYRESLDRETGSGDFAAFVTRRGEAPPGWAELEW